MAFSMGVVRTAGAADEALERAATELARVHDAVSIERRTRKVEFVEQELQIRDLFGEVMKVRERLAALVKRALEEGA